MILCDTNILIELYKGNQKIISDLKNIREENICISDVISAELLYGARDKKDLDFLKKQIESVVCLPINESISRTAVELIHKFSLSHNLGLADGLIAATAIYHDFELFTLNTRDFRFIENLKLYPI